MLKMFTILGILFVISNVVLITPHMPRVKRITTSVEFVKLISVSYDIRFHDKKKKR